MSEREPSELLSDFDSELGSEDDDLEGTRGKEAVYTIGGSSTAIECSFLETT